MSLLWNLDLLGDVDLVLNDRTNYRLVAFGPGVKRRRRITVSSPYVHGELVTASPLALTERLLVVRVLGTSTDNLMTLMSNLDAAFSQEAYTVTGSADGVDVEWEGCTPADFEPGDGGVYNKFLLYKHWQEVKITVPSNPIAGHGPW